MDRRTIETRLREIANGADMITLAGIRQYTGADYEWVHERLNAVGAVGVGGTRRGKRYHIRDVARALDPC